MARRTFGPDRWGIVVLAGVLLAGTARVGPAPLAASFDERLPAVSLSADEGERFKRRARLVRVPDEDTEEVAYEQPDAGRVRELAAALGLLGFSSAFWLARRRKRFLASV